MQVDHAGNTITEHIAQGLYCQTVCFDVHSGPRANHVSESELATKGKVEGLLLFSSGWGCIFCFGVCAREKRSI